MLNYWTATYDNAAPASICIRVHCIGNHTVLPESPRDTERPRSETPTSQSGAVYQSTKWKSDAAQCTLCCVQCLRTFSAEFQCESNQMKQMSQIVSSYVHGKAVQSPNASLSDRSGFWFHRQSNLTAPDVPAHNLSSFPARGALFQPCIWMEKNLIYGWQLICRSRAPRRGRQSVTASAKTAPARFISQPTVRPGRPVLIRLHTLPPKNSLFSNGLVLCSQYGPCTFSLMAFQCQATKQKQGVNITWPFSKK